MFSVGLLLRDGKFVVVATNSRMGRTTVSYAVFLCPLWRGCRRHGIAHGRTARRRGFLCGRDIGTIASKDMQKIRTYL